MINRLLINNLQNKKISRSLDRESSQNLLSLSNTNMDKLNSLMKSVMSKKGIIKNDG